MKRTLLLLLSLVFYSIINAQNWTPVTSGTSFILYGMTFPEGSTTTAYACGMSTTYDGDGVIIKTTDGGDNWNIIFPTSGTIDGLQGIWFIDENTGFAAGWNNYFIKTTDGGDTWTQVPCGSNMWYYTDVVFYDQLNGVATGYMSSAGVQAVFITEDGGNTWTQAASGTDANIMSITYADATTLFTVNANGQVRKSTDGGYNWTVISTIPALGMGIEFADLSFGIIGAEEKIFSTTDGGATWSTFTTGYENFYAIKTFTNGTAYVGGTDERIWKTTNYGQNWSLVNSGTGTSSLYRIRQSANGNLFASGSQGRILKFMAPLYAGFTADSQEICEGDQVQFNDASTGNITGWNWTFEGGTPATSTAMNPTVTYAVQGTYNVTLEVTDGNNTNTLTEYDFVTVDTAPIQPDQPAGPEDLCGGETATYTTNTLTGLTYVWHVDPSEAGSITGNGTTGTFSASSTFSGSFTITVATQNNCGLSAWSTPLNGTLNELPVAYNLSDGGAVCPGSSGVEIWLSDSETGVDYTLYMGGVSTGVILAGTGEWLSFGLFSDPGLYTVTGNTAFCTNDMIGMAYLYSAELPEQASTPSGETEVCGLTTTAYTATLPANADQLTWTLTPVEAGIMTPSGTNATVEWAGDFVGEATLEVMGSNDCGDGQISDPLLINVHNLALPDISGSTTVCDLTQETYTTEELPGLNYLWTVVGGDIVEGAGSSSITVDWGTPGTGSVELELANEAGCTSPVGLLEITIENCTAIESASAAFFQIFPNPVNDHLTIRYRMQEGTSYRLQLTDSWGRSCNQYTGTAGGHEMEITMMTGELSAGTYVVTLSGNQRILMQRRITIMH